MKSKQLHLGLMLIVVLGLCVLSLSCAKKKAVTMPEMVRYEDSFERFSLSYPKTWLVQADAQQVRIYSSEVAMDKFLNPTSPGQGGCEIALAVKDLDTLKTLNQIVARFKAEDQGVSTFAPEERVTLAGYDAIKVPYATPVDARNTIHGFRTFALENNTLYTFGCAAFNELFEEYKAIFDSTTKSMKLAKPKVTAARAAEFVPSETYETYSSNYCDVTYPDNFEYSFPKRPKESEFLIEFKGVREDCILRVEVSPAKKNPVEKIFEVYKADSEKSGKYVIRGSGESTIDGNKAPYLNLSLKGVAVDSKAYFVVKSDKRFYIFLSWYRPEAAFYLPAFEKSVATMKIKI